MVLYTCFRCGYSVKHKNTLRRHLNRKYICDPTEDDVSINDIKKFYKMKIESNLNPNESNMNPNESISTPNNSISTPNYPNSEQVNESILNPNESIFNPSESKLNPNESNFNPNMHNEKYKCSFCNKYYTNNSNMRKHERKCIKKKEFINQHDKIIKMEKELEEFKKTQSINTQSINTQNNNITKNSHNTTNTININNYGDENLSFLKSKDFLALFNGVYTALPKLIEKIHFNPKHPENHNIKYTNKNYPYLKIIKEKKWQLVDKKYEILDLIDNKCFMFKENFDKILKKKKYNITDFQKTKIEEFLQKYHEEDKILMHNLFKSTELLLLNKS